MVFNMTRAFSMTNIRDILIAEFVCVVNRFPTWTGVSLLLRLLMWRIFNTWLFFLFIWKSIVLACHFFSYFIKNEMAYIWSTVANLFLHTCKSHSEIRTFGQFQVLQFNLLAFVCMCFCANATSVETQSSYISFCKPTIQSRIFTLSRF